MTWLIILLILAAFGGFLGWMHRHYANGAPGEVSWLGRLRDSVMDWIRSFTEPETAPAAGEAPQPAPAPRAPLPPPPPAATAPGGNGAAPSPPEQERQESVGTLQSDVLHSIGYLVNRAINGDIRDVRRVIKTLATAADALGHGVSHLGTRLSEPDKHYGAEIWEPLTIGGAQLRAASLHCAQSDAMVTSLLATTVGELADSPRQAPHHAELNGPA